MNKKILVLAEKPTQGKLYAQALGGFTQKDGYCESDKYIITWAFGHLIDLVRDDVYREDKRWSKNYLPFLLPLEDYKYEPKADKNGGVKKQLKTIASLMKQASEVYCATDADREGELIFRYIYNYLGCKLPYKRIWLRALEDEEIKKAFANPEYKQGDSFLENLSKSAYIRAISDWLIGMNGTQAASLQFGKGDTLSIGRVQTTILKIICERYEKNQNHQKSYTYKIITAHSYNGVPYLSQSPIFETKEQTEAIFKKLKENHIFKSYQKKNKVEKPPLLHTLDSLTVVANKLYKYNASQVLASAQKLYESKLISYPRTEDPYITEEGYNKLKKSLLPLISICLNISEFSFPSQKPASVDGSKITGSHDALIPTGQTAGIDKLSEQDRQIFDLILYRCLESFSQEAIYEKGVYNFENEQVPFVTHTNKLLQLGWKKYSPNRKGKEQEDEEGDEEEEFTLELPYKEGDKVLVDKKSIREIESKPPKIYTPATLTEDLSNLAKFLQQEDPDMYNSLKEKIDLKSLQIGTKATRPNLLETLQNRKFITFQKNKYIPTELGMNFYKTIKDLEVVNVAETAKLEYNLSKVTKGEMTEKEVYEGVKEYIKKMVAGVFGMKEEVKGVQEGLGMCPICKRGQVLENPKAYGCSEYKNGCEFTIWKEMSSKKIPKKNIEELISKKESSLIKGFKNKAGKEFEAYIYLDEKGKPQFRFKDK